FQGEECVMSYDPISQEELTALREKIAETDEQIMLLLKQRMQLAQEVGKVKAHYRLPIKDYRVEKSVIDRNRSFAKENQLYASMADEVSQLLIKYAVLAQNDLQTKYKPDD